MMAISRSLDNRWLRRYRIFFVIGLVILIFQLYLAYKFFTIHAKDSQKIVRIEEDINVYNLEVVDENSARHLKDGFIIDDEDAVNSNNFIKQKQPYEKSKLLHSTLNKTNLRIEELDFIPMCNIQVKEAVSAIHRAKTQQCKQLLVNLTCLIQEKKLYPEILPNSCPNKDLKTGRSLGCYKDEKNFRLLNGYYANFKTSNSPDHCIQMCLQSGFSYAGVQYSTECFCGNEEPPSTARLPDSSCNMKCPANPKQACGGYYTINIYQTGITAFTPQTAELTTRKGDSPVRIAYILTLNGRALRQVHRLIKALFQVDHYFYIHVDSRQDYLFRELLILESRFKNIRLARHRFATIWGGASLLQTLLSSMRQLLASEWKWDYVINLSESDFPIKTSEELVEFLTANRGRNFVKSHGREVQRFIQKQGLDKTFVECDTHMWRIGDRKLPHGVQIDGGSDWVALSRPFVEYVATEDPDQLVKGLLTVFKYTLLSAESFFHTALRNSKFCNTYVDNNLHITNWKRRLGCKCQYKHVVDWCGCSPNDFKPGDWQRILATKKKKLYFARKFEPIISQSIILQLEQWLYGNYLLNVSNIDSYWQSIYHYADVSPLPDDSVITVAMSFMRIASKNFSSEKCLFKPSELIQLSSYHQNDVYKGAIVTYNLNYTNYGRMKFESWVKPLSNIKVKKSTPLLKRLKTFYVTSDYDQKEQVSRNFAKILGPFSEPTLIYEFLFSVPISNKNYNLTFLWIDPVGDLAEITEVHIDSNHVLNHTKPVFKQPLLPGIWMVKLIHDKTLLAQCTFLITPLEFLSKTTISQTQAVFTHSGNSYNTYTTEWDTFLTNKSERAVLKAKSVANSKRHGRDLEDWIDSLIIKHYSFQSTCVEAVHHFTDLKLKCGDTVFKLCTKTTWSTYAEDIKSEINSFNHSKGRGA